ncbi:hypothetical protein V490_06477 [Pseudogymnoascus sp. VKM F-3557]|nr:hypothetical protein V490_06477 [Pseudogymnoascus sp. VKM F-3557]
MKFYSTSPHPRPCFQPQKTRTQDPRPLPYPTLNYYIENSTHTVTPYYTPQPQEEKHTIKRPCLGPGPQRHGFGPPSYSTYRGFAGNYVRCRAGEGVYRTVSAGQGVAWALPGSWMGDLVMAGAGSRQFGCPVAWDPPVLPGANLENLQDGTSGREMKGTGEGRRVLQ